MNRLFNKFMFFALIFSFGLSINSYAANDEDTMQQTTGENISQEASPEMDIAVEPHEYTVDTRLIMGDQPPLELETSKKYL